MNAVRNFSESHERLKRRVHTAWKGKEITEIEKDLETTRLSNYIFFVMHILTLLKN